MPPMTLPTGPATPPIVAPWIAPAAPAALVVTWLPAFFLNSAWSISPWYNLLASLLISTAANAMLPTAPADLAPSPRSTTCLDAAAAAAAGTPPAAAPKSAALPTARRVVVVMLSTSISQASNAAVTASS